jgi:Ribbon-helix-helix protein, copG family.
MRNNDEKYNTDEKRPQRPLQCVVCGAKSNTIEYTSSRAPANGSTVTLCPGHEQLFTILGQTDSPTPARSINESTQQTTKMTVRLPEQLLDSADASAKSQGQTRSELIRDAVQIYIELSEIDVATNDLLSQAINKKEQKGNQTHDSDVDVAFLKERIRRLEELLENSIERI